MIELKNAAFNERRALSVTNEYQNENERKWCAYLSRAIKVPIASRVGPIWFSRSGLAFSISISANFWIIMSQDVVKMLVL